MGSSSSTIPKDDMEEYVQLLYLNKTEIKHIRKRFISINPNQDVHNLKARFHYSEVVEAFPELKVNPFQDRFFHVFSSQKDDCFSLEDMLDMFSVLSENCPDRVKALWAFQIFDFDDDKFLNTADIMTTIDRLVGFNDNSIQGLSENEKKHIAQVILKEVDLAQTGGITPMEFVHAILKLPEFGKCFRYRA